MTQTPSLLDVEVITLHGQVPDKDVPYDLIIWYVSEIIYLS